MLFWWVFFFFYMWLVVFSCSFPFSTSLFCVFSVITMITSGLFLFWPCASQGSVYFLYLYGCVFPKFGGVFFCDLIKDLDYAISWDSFTSFLTLIQRFGIWWHPTFPACFYPVLLKQPHFPLLILSRFSTLAPSPDTLSPAWFILRVRLSPGF